MEEGLSVKINEIGSILKQIIGILLPLITGYFLHRIKSKFDKKDIQRATSKIVVHDIEKAIKLTNKSLESEIKCVFSNKFTTLDDWRKDFQILVPKLNKVQRKQFIEFYNIISDIKDVQNDTAILVDEFYKSRNFDKHRPILMEIPGRRSLDKEFIDLLNELKNADVQSLILALDKI